MNPKKRLIAVILVLVLVVAVSTVTYNIMTRSETVDAGPSSLNEQNSTEQNSSQSSQNQQGGTSDNTETGTETRQEAFDFEMFDGEGNAIQLSSFKGKPVVLNFWASWCPPCKQEMPDFEKMYQEYGDQVQFVMLNVTDGQRETVEIAKQFISYEGFTFPVFFDENFEGSIAYWGNAIPMTVIIDKDGYIASYQIGSITTRQLRDGIIEVLP